MSKPVSFFVLDWLVFNTDLNSISVFMQSESEKKATLYYTTILHIVDGCIRFRLNTFCNFFFFFLFSISPLKRLLSSYTFCGWTKNVLINFQWGPNWADRGKTYSNKVNLELMFLLIYCLNMNGRECMKIDKLMCKPCWLDLMNEFCVNCLEYQLGKTMQGLLVLIDC